LQSFNIQFKDKVTLTNYITVNKIHSQKNVLVQIFSGVTDENEIIGISSYIKELVPSANIIGTTTAGEIYNGKMFDKTIILSFTVFQSTIVKSKLFDLNEDFDIQKEFSNIITKKTKALIVFSDRLKSDAEELLKRLSQLYPNVIIAGGRAGYDINLKKTLIFNDKTYSQNGCVMATLSGDDLIANSDYMLNWNQIGKNMKVTKMKDNILYEVDGLTAQKLYEKYLGKEVADSLPSAGAEFPLISIKNNVEIARVPISLEKDGALRLSGTFNEGDIIRFSYANIVNIQNSICENYEKFKNIPSESIFIYSCVGRKNLIGEELQSEFKMLDSLANSTGFFTNGEYFHSHNTNELLNMTTTFLFLSETAQVEEKNDYLYETDSKNTILKALSHLTNITTKELEHKNKELQRLSDMTSKIVLYTTADLKGNILSVSKAYEEFTNLSAEELIGQNHNIFRHENTPYEFYDKLWETIENDKRFVGEMQHKLHNNKYCWIKITIDPLFDEDGNKIGYSSYREDITERKKLEFISSHDTLTSLYNRGEFTRVIDAKIKSIQRHGGTFGFVIFDIDHFKVVNDTYGHKVGDDVLVTLAKFISSNTRADDFVARWGGEEFVLIVNNANIKELEILIQKLQNKLTEISFSHIKNLTLSFGLTQYKKGDTKDSILNRADIALYSAKEKGRNRYEIN